MQVHVALPQSRAPIKVVLDSRQKLSDEAYWAFCQANPGLRVERSAEGEIIIVPPAGGESGYRTVEVGAELHNWAKRDGRGKAFGATVQFFLPDGSGLSPDAAWVSNESLKLLTREERKRFLRLTPQFVVEIRSPSDRLKDAMDKMDQWMANGVELAWLIDGDAKTVSVYRAGKPAEKLRGISKLAGEGPVKGFVLKLRPIWEGLGRI
jgi:Uma2 family endonuclease